MKDFKELKVWQKAHGMTVAVYLASRSFPKEEIYGLRFLPSAAHNELEQKVVEVQRMLTALVTSVQQTPSPRLRQSKAAKAGLGANS
jgi:hypothetical protein